MNGMRCRRGMRRPESLPLTCRRAEVAIPQLIPVLAPRSPLAIHHRSPALRLVLDNYAADRQCRAASAP
ncbi:Hypothetical protein NTJ_01731 [Nesidiocoris tenuis]|uniref:Uncharacterized protein n=1 Tax=Nesidiocoris tenuis TaxID=355587 RepID=A0ABN7AA91_9HEMI|nr:Hypothetical protein NTJ_01731 [Nesidiocoris tenuis]